MSRSSRRELLALLAAGALAPAAARGMSAPSPGRVGVAEAAAGLGRPLAAPEAARAVAAAVAAATDAVSAADGLRGLFSPQDTVGIKLNCLAGRLLSPRVELVEAFVDLLASAGVDRGRIIVFERTSRELERAGFTLRSAGAPYRCVGIDNDFDREPSESGSIGSCFARLVSSECTALVSFGVVKDHDLAGVSAGMKNWYGVIHNPNKYHQDGCDPFIADVARHPYIRGRLRLTVLDGVVAQYHGGPAYRPGSTFDLGRVAVSRDPVAADVWAWQAIEAARREHGLPSLEAAGRSPRYLTTAARHGLGVAEPEGLEVAGP